MRRVVFKVAEEAKPALCMRFRRLVERMVVDARRGPGDLAVIGRGVEVQYCEAFLQEVDTWNEGFALDAVFVQVVWVSVTCCDDDGTVCHERFHESAQDHGVGYVGALELVKAEYRRALCYTCCYEGYRVNIVTVLHLHLVEVFVHALHEGVEVYACLALDVGWESVVEQVHHHGLAGAYVAEHVHALWQRIGYWR